MLLNLYKYEETTGDLFIIRCIFKGTYQIVLSNNVIDQKDVNWVYVFLEFIIYSVLVK